MKMDTRMLDAHIKDIVIVSDITDFICDLINNIINDFNNRGTAIAGKTTSTLTSPSDMDDLNKAVYGSLREHGQINDYIEYDSGEKYLSKLGNHILFCVEMLVNNSIPSQLKFKFETNHCGDRVISIMINEREYWNYCLELVKLYKETEKNNAVT